MGIEIKFDSHFFAVPKHKIKSSKLEYIDLTIPGFSDWHIL